MTFAKVEDAPSLTSSQLRAAHGHSDRSQRFLLERRPQGCCDFLGRRNQIVWGTTRVRMDWSPSLEGLSGTISSWLPFDLANPATSYCVPVRARTQLNQTNLVTSRIFLETDKLLRRPSVGDTGPSEWISDVFYSDDALKDLVNFLSQHKSLQRSRGVIAAQLRWTLRSFQVRRSPSLKGLSGRTSLGGRTSTWRIQ